MAKCTRVWCSPHKWVLEELELRSTEGHSNQILVGCTYQIYKQDIPEINMSTHLMKWGAFLQKLQPNQAPEDDEFIFPYITPNGIVHPKRDMSYDLLQELLTKFATAASLKKHYTTHCFWRGGAQYRFSSAHVGRRWPLSWIQWWGGWVIGENVSGFFPQYLQSGWHRKSSGRYVDEILDGLTTELWKWAWECPPPHSTSLGPKLYGRTYGGRSCINRGDSADEVQCRPQDQWPWKEHQMHTSESLHSSKFYVRWYWTRAP